MHCSFGPITDEMIRDQIIVHVRSRRIQEQLWVMGDPKLQDVINTAKALEQSEKWMKLVQGTEKNKLSDMDVVGAIGAGGSTNDTFTKKTTWSRKDDKNNVSDDQGECGDSDVVSVVSEFISEEFKAIEERDWHDKDQGDVTLQEVKQFLRMGWPRKERILGPTALLSHLTGAPAPLAPVLCSPSWGAQPEQGAAWRWGVRVSNRAQPHVVLQGGSAASGPDGEAACSFPLLRVPFRPRQTPDGAPGPRRFLSARRRGAPPRPERGAPLPCSAKRPPGRTLTQYRLQRGADSQPQSYSVSTARAVHRPNRNLDTTRG
ncbi:hypothetical protein NDU88_004574 [Pleurodeles waltl]|uniref:Uncharacterized protein n=1 Tax=Pleurodeles waltl TaxID=8319 RepID=A0AAV7SJ63_PLEWA|nr:hypothetical protein NDU88_004574 [Pleurodeles waltl]